MIHYQAEWSTLKQQTNDMSEVTKEFIVAIKQGISDAQPYPHIVSLNSLQRVFKHLTTTSALPENECVCLKRMFQLSFEICHLKNIAKEQLADLWNRVLR